LSALCRAVTAASTSADELVGALYDIQAALNAVHSSARLLLHPTASGKRRVHSRIRPLMSPYI